MISLFCTVYPFSCAIPLQPLLQRPDTSLLFLQLNLFLHDLFLHDLFLHDLLLHDLSQHDADQARSS
jgi:hypothetical protein